MADKACDRLKVMAVKRSMYPSLTTSHEPHAEILNTDGNGGIPQVVNTMLLFSRPARIDLLPALPKAWSAGSIRGLRARGGFEVDLEWTGGKVSTYHIRCRESREVQVRMNGETRTVKSERQ